MQIQDLESTPSLLMSYEIKRKQAMNGHEIA